MTSMNTGMFVQITPNMSVKDKNTTSLHIAAVQL